MTWSPEREAEIRGWSDGPGPGCSVALDTDAAIRGLLAALDAERAAGAHNQEAYAKLLDDLDDRDETASEMAAELNASAVRNAGLQGRAQRAEALAEERRLEICALRGEPEGAIGEGWKWFGGEWHWSADHLDVGPLRFVVGIQTPNEVWWSVNNGTLSGQGEKSLRDGMRKAEAEAREKGLLP